MTPTKASSKESAAAPPAKTPTTAPGPAAPTIDQSSVEHLAFQVNSPKTRLGGGGNGDTAKSAPYGVVIEDNLPDSEGQINRNAFMDELAPEIERTANDLLAPLGRTARDCPYLDFWLAFYRRQSAAHIERAIKRYVNPEQTDRQGIEAAILTRVGEAVKAWVERRAVEIPGDLDPMAQDDGVENVPADGAVAQRIASTGRGAPAPPGSAAAISAQLSRGRPLDSGIRTHMERGFGVSFGDVRLHTDSTASRLAQQYSARAFTVGNNIAFGAGQYRPSTLGGQALMAHELAHVLQQRGAGRDEGVTQSMALESSADSAAARALLARPGEAPARSGLRLARCGSTKVEPRDWTTEIPADAYDKAKRIQELQKERDQLLNQPGGNSQTSLRMGEIDDEIAKLAEQLQLEGFQGDLGQVAETAAKYGINALEVLITGLTGDTPSDLLWGERRRFDLDISFLPANVDINVTWKANNGISDIDVGHNNESNLALTLDEMFWGRWTMAEHRLREDGALPSPETLTLVAQLYVPGQAGVSERRSQPMTVREAMPAAKDIHLLSEYVLNPGPPEGRPVNPAAPKAAPKPEKSSVAATNFGTGAAGGVPAPTPASAAAPAPAVPQVLQDAHMFFKLSWLPPGDYERTPSYIVRWGVENLNLTQAERFQVTNPFDSEGEPEFGFWRCEFRFPDKGKFRVFAEIYQYPFTSATPPILASASSSVEVLGASEVGSRALETVTKGPALPDYAGFLGEMDAQIAAFDPRSGRGLLQSRSLFQATVGSAEDAEAAGGCDRPERSPSISRRRQLRRIQNLYSAHARGPDPRGYAWCATAHDLHPPATLRFESGRSDFIRLERSPRGYHQ